jgi:hypothetical protein
MDAIHALQQVFDISPTMMVRSVLGLSRGHGGGFGPVALFFIILVVGILGRYAFVIAMTHMRPINPFADMGRGQLLACALLLIPGVTVVLSGAGPVQARMEARILEPLGWSRAPTPTAETCAPDSVQLAGLPACPIPAMAEARTPVAE